MKRFTGHKEEWGTFLDVKHWPEIKNPKKYAGQRVVIGSVTDGYNPQEEQFGNTRKLLEQLIGSDADILICTKSDLVVRDIDLLKKLGRVTVSWSINTLDENVKNDMDSASSIERRIAAMKQVYDAGIRTVCFVSPVFPGITDFEAIFERVKDQCDLFWLENLNLRGGFKKTIMDYIAGKYLDLVPLYDEIYNKHKGTFSIYQLKHGDETRDLRFEPYDRLQATGNVVDKANYELVYSAELTPGTSLEDIYTRFNIDHPKDFKGHSLSVSDVVVLHQNGQDAAHYVDSFGYKNVPEFLQEQKQLTPDELETGETIKTPRGTFYVTDMSREQMEAAGYGFHHQSDDGKYLVMGNGTRAFAIAAEQRENPLKAAEQTTEQNENMIDGIINNTPTVDELEAKVKAGETISLVDLANAVKADKERGKGKPEKKPSIRAQLKADKEKAQKKAAAKTKNHDLEV